MSAPSLPARANLEFLKKQSKDLHRAFAAGEPDALERIRTHLRRAGPLDGDALRAYALTLQEAQHALACEYGFGKWDELVAAVEAEPGFEDLARLSDRETQTLMLKADQRDLVWSLADAGGAIRERFLCNMSDRVRGFIESEMETDRPPTAADAEAARARVLTELSKLREARQVTWPPPAASSASAGPSPEPHDDPRLSGVCTPLADLTVDEVAQLLLALAEQARKWGILSLESYLPTGKGTLLTEGVRLAVDGTEPPLIADLLATRAATILRQRTLRGQMAMHGWLSVRAGDNPYITAQKLTSFFVEDSVQEVAPQRTPTVAELQHRLADTPLSAMALAEVVELYRDLAFQARREGIATLAPLLAQVDDPVLAAGMKISVDTDPGVQRLVEVMGQALQEARAALHERHCLVIQGIISIQAGRKPAELVADARRRAAAQAEALSSEAYTDMVPDVA